MIIRKDTILNIKPVNDTIQVKIPDDISINQFVLSIFILMFIIRIKNPNDWAKLLEQIITVKLHESK